MNKDVYKDKFDFFVIKYLNMVNDYKQKNFKMKTETIEEELSLLKEQSKIIENMLINEISKWRVSYILK